MARDKLTIFNEAIGGVPADPVDSVDDNRKSGRECRRFYDGVVDDLLECHNWWWARRRKLLAVVENDRDGEWAYAYALPTNVASAVVVVPNYGSGSSLPGIVTTPYHYWQGAGSDYQAGAHQRIRFVVSGGKLYTDLSEAVLEYVSSDNGPPDWPSLFSHAVIRTLEMRIFKPILGSEAAGKEYVLKARSAEMAKDEAVAHDLNQQTRLKPKFASAAEMARLDGSGDQRWRR